MSNLLKVKAVHCWYCKGKGCKACNKDGYILVKVYDCKDKRFIDGLQPQYKSLGGQEIGPGHRRHGVKNPE